jgi:hypothetical protein
VELATLQSLIGDGGMTEQQCSAGTQTHARKGGGKGDWVQESNVGD